MRRSLPLTALAVAALALPASAARPTPPSNCATYLVAAKSGGTNSCGTLGESPAISGATPTRNLNLTVLSGAATATLACGGDPQPSRTVVLDGPGTASGYVEGGGNCWVTVTATAPLTTAVASNTWGYVFK